ncbi:MAG: hypothetical protein M3247_01380 [Thermoproteota archaeon]|nr:hypothetical protein [Thermoproteota archaeon]
MALGAKGYVIFNIFHYHQLLAASKEEEEAMKFVIKPVLVGILSAYL